MEDEGKLERACDRSRTASFPSLPPHRTVIRLSQCRESVRPFLIYTLHLTCQCQV